MMASVPQMRPRPSVAAGEAGAPAGAADADLFARLLAATPRGAGGEASLPDLATPEGGDAATPEEGASPEELVNLLAPPVQAAAPAPAPMPVSQVAPQPVPTEQPAVTSADPVPVSGQQAPTTPIDQVPPAAPAAAPLVPVAAKAGIDSKAPAVSAPVSPPPLRAPKAVKAEALAPVAAPEGETSVEVPAKPVPATAHAKSAEVRPEALPPRPVVGAERRQGPTPVKAAATRIVERAAAPVVETAQPSVTIAAPVLPMPQAQPLRAEASSDVPAPVPADAPELDLQTDAEWLDRLARDIARAGDGSAPLRFRLHPQTLGHLGVELAQTEQGTAIRLTAETEAARALIAEAQPRLLAEARAQGVRIAEAQVDLAGSGGRDGSDPRRNDEPKAASPRSHAAAADEREEPPETSDRFA